MEKIRVTKDNIYSGVKVMLSFDNNTATDVKKVFTEKVIL